MMGLAMLWFSLALSASPEDLRECLIRYDTPCAEEQAEALGLFEANDAAALAVGADVHFYAGRYPEAFDAFQRAVDGGLNDPEERLALYERALYTTAGWVSETRGRFTVRWRPGLDDLLVDEAFSVLETTEENLAPVMGGAPPGNTILELYPDTRSFIASSSLTADDVYTTGTVALSKWSRLLVTSPRARGQGYDWQDTVAHEYIHLVVAYRGNHRSRSVPVWLQEGIAKYLDSQWRGDGRAFELSTRQKMALSDALERDNLVSFEEMHPSLAKMPSAERAALAYAQLASLIGWCMEQGGDETLLRTLERTREGVDSRIALAEAVGRGSFDEMEQEWIAWLRAQDFVGGSVSELPMTTESGEDVDSDPALAVDKRRAEYVRLGDLLREHDEDEAALVEFRKAVDPEEPPSPLLANRLAQTLMSLEQPDAADQIIRSSIQVYPDFPMSRKTQAQIHEAQGQWRLALEEYGRASSFNPFDPEVLEALSRVSEQVGDAEGAERARAMLRIRRQGGDFVQREVLHDRQGTFELPRYDQHQSKSRRRDAHRERWVGERAPSWLAKDVQGGEIDPADHEGDVVVLDFWATWCGPCKKAMPALAELYEKEQSNGVVVVGLTDEETPRVRAFLSKQPVPYPIGVHASDVKRRYEVTSLPTVFVVGRDGRIVDVVVGASDSGHARIEEAVQQALGR